MVSEAPPHDLVLTGGRLVDPRNGIDGVRDVAISDGRVAAIAASLDPGSPRAARDLRGLLVTPGLIDLHTHIYHRATSYGVAPDPVAERSAVTCMVDAGSAGAGNFAGLRDFVIAPSRSRILAFLNISFPGIFAFDSGLMFGEASLSELLSVERCVAVVRENRDVVVGIKVRLGAGTSGRIGLEALERALEAARQTGLPVMTHIGKPPPGYDEILARLRPGDILTHCFRPAPNAPIDDAGRLLPALLEARRRGVLFDIGHGMGAFGFSSAEAAIARGFAPDIVSSDIHMLCVDGPAFDLLHTMSKLVTCGVGLSDVIAMATDAPAKAMRRSDLGHLSVGAPADISLLETVEARYPFVDVAGVEREGAMLFRPRGLLRAGQFCEPVLRSWETPYYREGVLHDH
ncbi:MAG: amidohydrolase/deacetylase family metallohydrolase [Nitratireductor sp.]